MAMSELKQQSIALWILLMLLILVPWALESCCSARIARAAGAPDR
jgi:hypothetical protein